MSDFIYVIKISLPKKLLLQFITLITLSVFGALSYSLIPYFLQEAVNHLTYKNPGYIYPIIVMILLYVSHDACNSIMSNYCQYLSVLMGNKIGEFYIGFLSGLPIQFIIEKGPARLTQILQAGKASLASNVNSLIYSVLPTAIQLLVAFSILLAMNDYLIFGLIIAYFACYALLSSFMVLKIAKIYMETVLCNIESSKTVNSIITNIETIKIFNAKNFTVSHYRESQSILLSKWVSYFRNDFSLEGIRFIFFSILMSVVLFYSAGRIISGQISIGHFVMINTYLLQICRPFESLVKSFGQILESFAGMKPLAEVLRISKVSKVPESLDVPEALNTPIISLKNVFFKYKGRSDYTLKNINLDLYNGDIISIKGASGSGKTTLLSLLLRLNTPCSGVIFLHGKDMSQVTDEEYYNSACLITQDSGVFNETLKFNLKIANPEASDSELMKAIELSCLHELFMKLPLGLDTHLGERGLQLSGGERQRLNIARSFLRNPDVIFYDESTSSIDEQTEKVVLNNIVTHHLGKTVVFITHHDGPVSYSNRLVSIHDGVFIEDSPK